MTLGVTVSPTVGNATITNIAVVEWSLADVPEQSGTADDAAVVAVTAVISQPPIPPAPVLPPTGSNLPEVAVRLALLVMGAGALLLFGSRRRKSNVAT